MINPAYELSFLKKEEQVDLLDAVDSQQATPSLSQAQRLKKYSQEGHLTLDMMRVIMGEEKKSDLDLSLIHIWHDKRRPLPAACVHMVDQ